MKKFYLILIILCFSCKKDAPIPETIKPLSYLPVFPGSYWKYINHIGDTVTQSTSAEYIEHRYSYGYEDNEISDPVLVPFWNGVPVYGYSSPLIIDPYPFYTQVLYLSETGGQVYKYSTRFGTISRFAVNTDTSLVLFSTTYNQVIKVNDYFQNPAMQQPLLQKRSFYAKDIGLVLQETEDDTLKIISYFIKR